MHTCFHTKWTFIVYLFSMDWKNCFVKNIHFKTFFFQWGDVDKQRWDISALHTHWAAYSKSSKKDFKVICIYLCIYILVFSSRNVQNVTGDKHNKRGVCVHLSVYLCLLSRWVTMSSLCALCKYSFFVSMSSDGRQMDGRSRRLFLSVFSQSSSSDESSSSSLVRSSKCSTASRAPFLFLLLMFFYSKLLCRSAV